MRKRDSFLTINLIFIRRPTGRHIEMTFFVSKLITEQLKSFRLLLHPWQFPLIKFQLQEDYFTFVYQFYEYIFIYIYKYMTGNIKILTKFNGKQKETHD